jgi:hypothetical protein
MADRPTAKMAESARNLPKWQPPANLVPNNHAKLAKRFFRVWHEIIFQIFLLTLDSRMV